MHTGTNGRQGASRSASCNGGALMIACLRTATAISAPGAPHRREVAVAHGQDAGWQQQGAGDALPIATGETFPVLAGSGVQTVHYRTSPACNASSMNSSCSALTGTKLGMRQRGPQEPP